MSIQYRWQARGDKTRPLFLELSSRFKRMYVVPEPVWTVWYSIHRLKGVRNVSTASAPIWLYLM